ncbi:caspase domain protein [Ralstonia insidiosa]|uniref:Caspase domain protein n=2 Tax=Ralstonia insidiosa TaxID=190721 RepID=A0AAC9BIR7_9RALS|nr:caspase domain protein [Ralstonia insidiosa]
MTIAVWLLCSGAAPAAAGTPVPAVSASTRAESIDYRTAPKFAVVIGNTRYSGRYALHNAENDARLIAASLKQAGYATELIVDADRNALYQALGRLAEQMSAGGAAAFYYAGHGMQIRGRNYLIPVGAPLDRPDALSQTAMPVDYLITRLKDSGAHLSLVMLDACRNDPDEGASVVPIAVPVRRPALSRRSPPTACWWPTPRNLANVHWTGAAPMGRSRRHCRTGSRAPACRSKMS